MTESTSRFALPLLQPGQAQKELFHNEALTAIDLAIHPAVSTAAENNPPTMPVPGRSWIVGNTPTGAWAGQAGKLAGWTGGGWRFVVPVAGMQAWVADMARWVWHDGTGWRSEVLPTGGIAVDGRQVLGAQAAAIPTPAGGATIDAEARVTLSAILAALRGHGLIDT